MADKKNNEKKYLTEREVLASGAVLKEYTQTDFLTVSPAPAIGKVKFSIVKQGTAGKDHADFYLGMEAFRLLLADLCSAAGIKKLHESADHQYPDAYKLTSGTDGSKHLNLGGGRKGVRIQIQEKPKGQEGKYRMVTIPFDALRSCKFRFDLVMGLIPTQEGSYYRSLYDAFWAGEEQREKYYRSSYDESHDGAYRPQEQKKEETPETAVYTVQTLGAVKRSGNTYYCPVKDKASGNKYNLCFTDQYLPNMGDKWTMFQEKAADGVSIRIRANIINNKMQFVGIDK
ncbi:MAG: hypothetical protein ACI4FX_03260 [Agathobacter sp.]